MSTAALSGHRGFTWYTPATGTSTEYEDHSVHYQQSPLHFAVQGWPIRFDDGRDPFIAASTQARASDWYAFRDPDALVSRRYFAELAADESSLERALRAALPGERLAAAAPAWVARGLAADLAAYPFYQHGLFIALCYAEREALADTITFATVFTAADRLRALQAVVRYSFELQQLPGYEDRGRTTWLEDPAWQGVRRAVEHLLVSRDWVEVLIAGLWVLDVIVGDVLRLGLFEAAAAACGDSVTPRVLSAGLADVARARRWVGALVHLLVNDAVHGAHNRELLARWSREWGEEATAAAQSLASAFASSGQPAAHEHALGAALTRLRSLWQSVGVAT